MALFVYLYSIVDDIY